MSNNTTAYRVGAQLNLGIDVPKIAQPVSNIRIQHGRTPFRPYRVNQLGLFPMEMEALLPADHLVFFV
ncbi:MAG: hypothetical protein ACRDHZ_25040, partial [Ktedonobacteraceae bacterium]